MALYQQDIGNISVIYQEYIGNISAICVHTSSRKIHLQRREDGRPLHISRPTLCSKQSLAPLHICMALVLVHLVVLVHLHGGGAGTFAWQEHQH